MHRFSPTLFLPIALIVIVAGVFLLFRPAQEPGTAVDSLTPTEAFRSEVIVGPSGAFGSASNIESATEQPPTAAADAGILPTLPPASPTIAAAAPQNVIRPTLFPTTAVPTAILPPSATPSPTPLPPEGICSASTQSAIAVNIRQYASLGGPIISALYPGRYLTVIAQSGTGWYEVFVEQGTVGWVSATVTTLHGPCGDLPLPTATLAMTSGSPQFVTPTVTPALPSLTPTPDLTEVGTDCAISFFFTPNARLASLCPSGAPVTVNALYQRFEHGYMLWDSQTNLISMVADDAPNGWPVKFTIDGPIREITETPPDGLFAPEDVFTTIWTADGSALTFGWATGHAVSYTTPFQVVDTPTYIGLMRLPGSSNVMGYTTDSSFVAGTMSGN